VDVAHDLSAFDEVVLELPQHRALVFGDVVLDGPRLCPESWLPEGRTREELADAIRPLLDEQIDLVLLTHGGPIKDGARE
jgi:glyoxylase-like metal-dependent hydrolase (beta-lactamase superfamily II)